ncbi:LysR family transcriptional regulator [Cobetia amphilecti]|uniref:LysR family transcriptional regulator n=2 Tax=Cobetia TaxID=204286 RepID=A0ABT6UU52_9GAMM|nr:LysR family transcriptional regulator [Cobetia amphilecti]MDI5885047.1 LysR family transcriptional regulator [Cobetia amphilecti]WOI24861.1 LysR family transcriptional regulator [Cobetia amphilecti]HAR08689.1 LysR family transcriptional regulator [Cobetia sp.]
MSLVQDRRISHFHEAARLGSVRAAADFLNVAPSAVSRQITQLEHELGMPLLERHRRGVKPTEAGERVLEYYRQRLAQQEVLLESLQSLKGLQSGSLVLAIGEGFIEGLAGPLSRFSARYPGIELKVNLCGTNEVIRQVVEDEAHLGLVFHPTRDPKIRTHVSRPQPVCAVVNPQHALAQQFGAQEGSRRAAGEAAPLSLAALAGHSLALPEVSFGIRQIVAQAEHQAGVMLSPTLTCNALAMLKQFALHGGVTLLPEFVVSEEVAAGRLCRIPLQEAQFVTPHVQLISRLGRQLSDGASRLSSLLQQDMTAFSPLEGGSVGQSR